MSLTWRAICTDVMAECGAIASGETPDAADIIAVRDKLRRLLNNWNADRRAVYASAFLTYTLTPNLQPHTIGPTGTWSSAQRPVSLDGANLILTNVNLAIAVVDAQWWQAQADPTITSTIPTNVYYQPDWPNGKLFFWPVPTAAYQVQLLVRVLLDDLIDLDTVFSLPPGYQDAITLTGAEDCLTLFPASSPGVTGMLATKSATARARIFANNDPTPRLQTADSGMQATGQRSTWNWRTGLIQ